ncbi:hypothetical protein MRX96_057111 [Rhipicephalus microplus]
MPSHGTTPSRSVTHSLSGTQATTDSVYGPTDHYCRPSGKNVRLCVREYAKHNSIQRSYSQFVLDFCRQAFSTESDSLQQFLDVGCGTGDFTRDVLMPQISACRAGESGPVVTLLPTSSQHLSSLRLLCRKVAVVAIYSSCR